MTEEATSKGLNTCDSTKKQTDYWMKKHSKIFLQDGKGHKQETAGIGKTNRKLDRVHQMFRKQQPASPITEQSIKYTKSKVSKKKVTEIRKAKPNKQKTENKK